MADKGGIRKLILKTIKDTAPEDFLRQGKEAAARLLGSSLWDTYNHILIFLSTAREIDTQTIIEGAFASQKSIYAPRIEGEDLHFYPLAGPHGPYSENPWGIREPLPSSPPLDPGQEKLLLICPGLAFDLRGRRLGRGRGYYDRFLAWLEQSGTPFLALGLCMDFQVLPEVPREDHDITMGAILTNSMLYYIQ